ncbi:MAG: triose-phosphate isomerase [Gemmatales bacterium]|nr:triose-phosphate isomerase [Gemmatales bacterium]MDW8176175.1 triose-phosphate isomerase [Gemmatales bacterium]
MRKKFVAGNWKMHTTRQTAISLAQELVTAIGQETAVDVAICPPFPYLLPVREVLSGSCIALGAQNVHPEPQGAFTGEVSPVMLRDCGCHWVIVGHSERRRGLGESHEFIRRKLLAAVQHGLQVILCIGETKSERDAGQTLTIVRAQLEDSLPALKTEQLAHVVLAYEPVWAIGTGVNATPEQAQEVHAWVRAWLGAHFGSKLAETLRILYGGSVNSANAASLLAQPDIDGVLVGGASLKASEFLAIIQAAKC